MFRVSGKYVQFVSLALPVWETSIYGKSKNGKILPRLLLLTSSYLQSHKHLRFVKAKKKRLSSDLSSTTENPQMGIHQIHPRKLTAGTPQIGGFCTLDVSPFPCGGYFHVPAVGFWMTWSPDLTFKRKNRSEMTSNNLMLKLNWTFIIYIYIISSLYIYIYSYVFFFFYRVP